MRHRKGNKKLGRPTAHRMQMLRNLITSLIVHERIKTTKAKAKAARSVVEKLITMARIDSQATRRRAFAILPNRVEVQGEDGKRRMTHVINKLFSELGPRYLDRPGGYTRILHYPKNRLGDNAEQVIFELVSDEDVVEKKSKKKSKSTKKKTKKQSEKSVASKPEAAEAVEPVKEEATAEPETEKKEEPAAEVETKPEATEEAAPEKDE